jgi:CYTH domain-containing protein
MNTNIEHELKYTIDLPSFYAWAQPFITRGLITTRIIRQWYLPDKVANNGVVRIRETLRPNGETELTQLTIKVPTDDPAIRGEFNFNATHDFNIGQFIDVLDIAKHGVIKDRWNITSALYGRRPGNNVEVVVDFFSDNGTTTGILEIENPPKDWVPPAFVTQNVTNDLTYTNYARAVDPNRTM